MRGEEGGPGGQRQQQSNNSIARPGTEDTCTYVFLLYNFNRWRLEWNKINNLLSKICSLTSPFVILATSKKANNDQANIF